MHTHGYAEHRGQGDEVCTHVAVDDGAVVGTPAVHYAVDILERSPGGIQAGGEPGGRPAFVGAVVKDLVLGGIDFHGPAFGKLQHGAQVLHYVHPYHRAGHTAAGKELGGEAAAAEVLTVGRHPYGGVQAGIGLFLRDFPEGLHCGFAVLEAASAAVQRGCTGVDKVDDSVCGLAFEGLAGDAFDGVGAPVGPYIGKDGGTLRHQVAQQHCDAVQGVVLGGQDEGFANAVPVEGRVQDGLGKITVGIEVCPLPLALETAQDGVVAKGFLSEAQLLELGIALEQVADDDGHLDGEFPVLVLFFAALLEVLAVAHILVLLAMDLGPGKGFLEFLVVVDAAFHTADNLHLVYAFAAHSQVVFEEVGIHDGTGYAHTDCTYREIGLTPHTGGCDGGAGKAEELFAHVGGDAAVIGILDVVAVYPEGGKAFLGVGGKHGCKIYGAGPFGSVEAPYCLYGVGIHIHRFTAVAPAGGDGDGHGNAFAGELFRAGGGFGHAADGGVCDYAFHGGTVGIAEFLAYEFRYAQGHSHSLVLEGFAYTVHSPVNGGPDADFGVFAHCL